MVLYTGEFRRIIIADQKEKVMHTLSIDYETFSSIDITKCGMHKYFESPDFEILLISYQFDDEPVVTLDLTTGQLVPSFFIDWLSDPDVLKTAHNAAFEIGASEKYFGTIMYLNQWECTQLKAAYMGWPLSLGAVAKAMNLEVEKASDGKRLIALFCCPVKPTKINGHKTRNRPEDYPAKWERFRDVYSPGDVVVEAAIRERLKAYKLPEREKELWHLDQKINRRGVAVDMELVRKVMEVDKVCKADLFAEAKDLTGMLNPNSPDQIKDWLTNHTGDDVESLKKEELEGLAKKFADDPVALRVIELRGDMSKTSISKYSAISMAVCADGRLRGLFQHYGANRTGRWAGRLTQVHNLVKNNLDSESDPNALDRARNIVLSDEGIRDKMYLLDALYGSVSDVLSKLIRTVFVPAKGNTLIVSDLASIEARILAWLAGEEWKLKVFRTHGRIYEATAAQMFGVPIEAVTKGSEYRRKAKISELALGYNGGPDAMMKMGAIKMGMVETELPKIVRMWRNANPKICVYWARVNEKAIDAIKQPGTLQEVGKGVSIICKNGYMFINLPSGRHLSYVRPRIVENRFGGEGIGYDGTTLKFFGDQETYGGKLVENIVQAIARDVLAEGLIMLDYRDYDVAMHVHDEVAIDHQTLSDMDVALTEVNNILSYPIQWAPGLPLGAEGFTGSYYKKD